MFRRWRERRRAEREARAAAPPRGAEVDLSGLSGTATPLPSVTSAQQAAASGSPAELNRLGVVLTTQGRDDEAIESFRKAAEAGSSDAAANLAGRLLAQGRKAEAAHWYRRAGGPLGEALAQSILADDDGRPRR